MASSEHLMYSNFIKAVHQRLRDETNTIGCDTAWQNHCENTKTLEEYAGNMKELATKCWGSNTSRIEWTADFIFNYFTTGLFTQRAKDIETATKLNLTIELQQGTLEKPRVLDVGSCYNPFQAYNGLDVLAIDLAPACAGVHKCDFLTVPLVASPEVVPPITALPLSYFNVVVFSLVLEYLPAPVQRLEFCRKAYETLTPEGILVIITPDSKHVGANAKFMKSWRFLLAKLGFRRIKYEKMTHLHCMVFRKCLLKAIAVRWADLQNPSDFYNEIFIPQDFNQAPRLHCIGAQCDSSLFEELPFALSTD